MITDPEHLGGTTDDSFLAKAGNTYHGQGFQSVTARGLETEASDGEWATLNGIWKSFYPECISGNPREMLIFFSPPSYCTFSAVELQALAFFPDLLSLFFLQTGFRCDFSIPALAGQHNEWRPLQKRLFHFIKPRSRKLGGQRISNLSTFTAV